MREVPTVHVWGPFVPLCLIYFFVLFCFVSPFLDFVCNKFWISYWQASTVPRIYYFGKHTLVEKLLQFGEKLIFPKCDVPFHSDNLNDETKSK